jgi:biotin synthase
MKIFEPEKISDIKQLTKIEIIELLQATGELQQQLFARAREIRQDSGIDKVTLRGVIEISNYCQKNCDYCAMRASNKELTKYRLKSEDILKIAEQIKEANIKIIFLQSGQDSYSDSILEEVIPILKQEFNFNILLCVGEKPKEVYQKYAELGADSYILKFETSDHYLYKQIAYTPLSKRLECLRNL